MRLILVMLLLLPVFSFADVTPTAFVQLVPGNSDFIVSYDLPKGLLAGGAGYGILRVGPVTLDVCLMSTSQETMIGPNISYSLEKVFKEGLFTSLWPVLGRSELGVNILWGYSVYTDNDGAMHFTWRKLPDYSLSLLLRY